MIPDPGSTCWAVVAGRRHALPPGTTLVVGRGDGADLMVESQLVSRRHVSLTHEGDQVLIQDLGSHRGTFVAGQRISDPVRVTPPVTIGLGPDGVPSVRLEAPDPGTPIPPPVGTGGQAGPVALMDRLLIGRDLAGRGLSLDHDLMVSRQHAGIERAADGWLVRDLSSRNGTFVNGARVNQSALTDGDRLTIGQTSFELRKGALHPYAENRVPSIVMSHVSRRLASGKILLDDVSVQLPPASMLAVVGPSGAGKSTLLGALTGDRPATSGQVLFAGRDLATCLEEIRPRIGVVPQDDIVHRQLRLREALLYAAELRLPGDVPREVRAHRVDEVLDELGLTEHVATRVDRLSGGQRKRASVAMELLTSPSFLLLDEPTSGLDPALDRQFMKHLRALADAGRTVVVISHNTSELHLCDAVLFLAPGGRVAYYGPPNELLGWFGGHDIADAFDLAYRQPEHLVQRFRAERAGRWAPGPVQVDPAPTRRPEALSGQRLGQQWWTLVRRHVSTLKADAGFLTFSAILPLALAALALLVPGDQGLGGTPPGAEPSSQPTQILLILTVGAIFMGLAGSIRELVAERTIFLRERAVGLSRSAYLLAKMAVLGAVVTVQVIAMLAIVLTVRDGPTDPIWFDAGAELATSLVAVGLANVALGLALSGLIRTQGQTMPVLVMAVMAQLVFTSGLFSLVGRGAIDVTSRLFPSRWGFAAGASVLDLNQSPRDDDELWVHTGAQYLGNLAAVAVFVVVLGALAWWAAGRKPADR